MWAKRFLLQIAQTRSGLSKDMKQEANSILRHFPSEYDMDSVAEKCPETFQKQMEPLYRMIKQYELERKKNELSTDGS
jgi:hypothetical protein